MRCTSQTGFQSNSLFAFHFGSKFESVNRTFYCISPILTTWEGYFIFTWLRTFLSSNEDANMYACTECLLFYLMHFFYYDTCFSGFFFGVKNMKDIERLDLSLKSCRFSKNLEFPRKLRRHCRIIVCVWSTCTCVYCVYVNKILGGQIFKFTSIYFVLVISPDFHLHTYICL